MLYDPHGRPYNYQGQAALGSAGIGGFGLGGGQAACGSIQSGAYRKALDPPPKKYTVREELQQDTDEWLKDV